MLGYNDSLSLYNRTERSVWQPRGCILREVTEMAKKAKERPPLVPDLKELREMADRKLLKEEKKKN